MHYIAASQIWQLLQHHGMSSYAMLMEGQEVMFSFSEEAEKAMYCFTNVFRDFLTSCTAIVSCPIPALAYLVAVMIWQ